MSDSVIILRYGELALKGGNRDLFERRMLSNIKKCLESNSIGAEVKRLRGRIYVYTSDSDAIKHLKRVFGLVNLSPAFALEKDIESVKNFLLTYLENILKSKDHKTFRITARRADKEFHLTSKDLCIQLGDFIRESFDLKVDLDNPDLNIGIEVQDHFYIFHEKLPCFGGLPLGMSGKVACFMDSEPSLLSAWLMMKRGCSIFPIAHKEMDISLLDSFAYGQKITLNIVEQDKIQEFMDHYECTALVTSQTLDNLTPNSSSSLVLTPLIAYSDEDITKQLENIRSSI